MREKLAREPAAVHLDEARLQLGREPDEGALEQPAAHPADDAVLVLLVAGERHDLAAAHRVAHHKNGRRAGRIRQVRLDEGDDVGKYSGCWSRQAPVRWLLDAASPAALVKTVNGDAARRERREEAVVAVDVVAESVNENELRFGGPFGLLWRFFGVS